MLAAITLLPILLVALDAAVDVGVEELVSIELPNF